MAEEIYKEWFVRLRFPDFDKVEILDGVPFGWKEKKIKDFGVVITGKTPSTTNQKYYGGNIPFIKTPDMRKYPYVDSSNEYLTKEGANSQNNKFLDKNTLIVGCIGSKAGAYSLVQEKSQTNQQINAIKFFKDEYTFYMYNFASNFSVILNLLGNSGSTMTNVNKSKFENIDVLMPSFEVLSQYHLIVKDNFEIILNLQQKNKNLKETRDLLLPKLIHGTLKI
jgi:type I restriction enzyme S subunit